MQDYAYLHVAHFSSNGPILNTQHGDSNAYPGVLLGRDEHPLLQFEVLGGKQVQIRFLLWLFLCFTFLNPLNFCRQERQFFFLPKMQWRCTRNCKKYNVFAMMFSAAFIDLKSIIRALTRNLKNKTLHFSNSRVWPTSRTTTCPLRHCAGHLFRAERRRASRHSRVESSRSLYLRRWVSSRAWTTNPSCPSQPAAPGGI